MRKKTNEIKGKRNFWLFLIGGIVGVLALGQLFISHQLSTSGEVIGELETKAAWLEETNSRLSEETSQVGSLSRIAQKAESLGLVRTNNILYLTPQVPVALRPHLPTGQ